MMITAQTFITALFNLSLHILYTTAPVPGGLVVVLTVVGLVEVVVIVTADVVRSSNSGGGSSYCGIKKYQGV